MDYDDDLASTNQLNNQLKTLLTAKNRPLRMQLSLADGVSSDILLPQRIRGVEAICDGIDMCIDCLSLNAQLPL